MKTNQQDSENSPPKQFSNGANLNMSINFSDAALNLFNYQDKTNSNQNNNISSVIGDGTGMNGIVQQNSEMNKTGTNMPNSLIGTSKS